MRAARPLVMIEACLRGDGGGPRVGFTATRKIGNAVIRNRAKRRLREAVRQTLPACARPGADYVFIARAQTADAPWAALLDDVSAALLRLDGLLAAPPPRRGRRDPERA